MSRKPHHLHLIPTQRTPDDTPDDTPAWDSYLAASSVPHAPHPVTRPEAGPEAGPEASTVSAPVGRRRRTLVSPGICARCAAPGPFPHSLSDHDSMSDEAAAYWPFPVAWLCDRCAEDFHATARVFGCGLIRLSWPGTGPRDTRDGAR